MKLTTEETAREMARIDGLDQMGLARLMRFAPAGDPVFCNDELYTHFQARFRELGGMTPAVSKAIGW